MAVILDRLFAWFQVFGIKTPDRKAAAEHYRAALEHLPESLVALAVSRLCATWKYGRMPLPGDLTALVEDDYSALVGARNRAAESARRAQRRHEVTVGADPAEVERLIQAVVAGKVLKP